MIRQGHIDQAEAILVIWFAIGAKVVLNLPAAVTAHALTAGWMVVLGGGLLSLAAFLPGVLLMRRFPGLPYARAGDEAAGLVPGKIAGVVTAAFLILLSSLTLRESAEAFATTLLPTTPVVVIILVFALTMGYSAYAGVEALGRLVVFFVPWVVAILGLVLLGEVEMVDLRHLFPLWGRGPTAVAADMATSTSLYSEMLLLPILYPYLRRRRQAVRVGVWAILLSTVLLSVVQVVIVGAFDVSNTDRLVFPLISLARFISFGRLFSRVEALVILVWIFAAAIQSTALLWAVATNLAECLRLPDHRPLITPLAAVIAAAATVPVGMREAAAIDFEYVHRWGAIVAFGLPLALWLLAVVRGKRGPGASDQADESGASAQTGEGGAGKEAR